MKGGCVLTESPTSDAQITEVTLCASARALLRCKIACRISIRRGYETNRCFHAAGCLEFCGINAGPRATHDSRRKCAPVAQGGQEAAEDVKQGIQKTTESNEEDRKSTRL